MRFNFSRAALRPDELSGALADPACGAFVTFEGRVRNHQDSRSVHRLEYESYESLAVKEGERILEEACSRFKIVGVACAHRVGVLEPGDLAVWVGVTAHHRDPAFAACRYVIDEVKARVPIWKKEFYSTGDSGWVNCELPRPPAV